MVGAAVVVAGAVEVKVVLLLDAIIGPPPVKLRAPTTLLIQPSKALSAPVNVEQGARSKTGDVDDGLVIVGAELGVGKVNMVTSTVVLMVVSLPPPPPVEEELVVLVEVTGIAAVPEMRSIYVVV